MKIQFIIHYLNIVLTDLSVNESRKPENNLHRKYLKKTVSNTTTLLYHDVKSLFNRLFFCNIARRRQMPLCLFAFVLHCTIHCVILYIEFTCLIENRMTNGNGQFYVMSHVMS